MGFHQFDLIVVLGHQNDLQGGLSSVARGRCDVAITLAAQHPSAKILATGTFGSEFNRYFRPHGELLCEYLTEKGIDSDRILPHTLSARTLEDAIRVRYAVIEFEYRYICVVTSDFHLERVQFLFSRILPEFSLKFVSAITPRNNREIADERRKYNREIANWMDFPLYGAAAAGKEFPSSIYENASQEQKTYDQISYAVVAATFAIFAFPYVITDATGDLRLVFLLATCFCILLLFILYVRTAIWANASRRILYLIESQWARPGFSYNHLHHQPNTQIPSIFKIAVKNVGFGKAVSALIFGLLTLQTVMVARVYLDSHLGNRGVKLELSVKN